MSRLSEMYKRSDRENKTLELKEKKDKREQKKLELEL